ncbi:MAG: hypothetical protein ACRBK7_02700 [Acidimicrobiales bacterium]
MDTTEQDDFDPNDPIAVAWAQQGPADDTISLPTEVAELADSLAVAHRKDQRRLVWLNIREVVPSFLLAGFFGAIAPSVENPWAAAVSAVICFLVGAFLLVSSIRHHRADNRWGDSVREQLERRVAQLHHRAWMYANVAWWYFLPLGLSNLIVLFSFGGSVTGQFEQIYVAGGVILYVAMYRKSRKVGRERYEVEAERLELLLAEMDQVV